MDKEYAEILKGLAVPVHAEPAMDRAIDLLERKSARPTPMKFLKMIRQACTEGDCDDCPFFIERSNLEHNCMFLGSTFERIYPCAWDLEKVEEQLND